MRYATPVDVPADEIEVVAPAADPRSGSVQVTVVEVDDTLPDSADVASAVQRAPGVVVQRLGGLGDWSSVSIRGATARQVEVFLDGLPLNPEGGAVTNLSELPLRAFTRVEVYRGAAPLTLDTAASGGAIQLVTGTREGARGSLAAGSWNTLRASVVGIGAAPLGDVFASVDGLATEGDFPWFDDGGTASDPGDDRFRRRGNNDTEQLTVHARWRVGDEALGLTLFDAWLSRDEGVPGPTFAPVEQVRYAVDRHLPAVTGHGVVGASRLEGRVWGVRRRERLDDPLGELGAPRVAETGIDAIGARAQVETAPSAQTHGVVVASIRHDRVDGRGVRDVGRVGAEGVLEGERTSGSLAVRGLVTEGQSWGLPRVGARWATDRWAVKGGLGRSVRIPDLTERYGDRGTLVGNPDLRAETAWGGDLSLGLTAGGGGVELGGFATDSRDRIVWTRNAQGLSRPDNVARARIVGAEVGSHWAVSRFEFQSALTLTSAIDRQPDPAYRGNQLPGVPWIEAYHRTGWRPGRVSVAHDLSFTAGTFEDATNFRLQAPRWLHGVTAGLHDRSDAWAISIDVRNLTDRRVQQVPRDPLVDDGERVPAAIEDFAGMPLAGRTVMVSVRARR